MALVPIPPHEMHTFDIRPVLVHIDMHSVFHCALGRYQKEHNLNPDFAFILNAGSKMDQQILAHQAQVIDDFIVSAINSFEHTWVQRNLSGMTRKELDCYHAMPDAWKELFRTVKFKPEHSGMFAHYQRINETIFLAIPTY